MRKAAGIILIILGMWGLIGLISVVIILSDSGMNPYLPFFLGRIVGIPFLVISGILCLRKKYWRVCLASASFAVLMAIFKVVEPSVRLGRFHMHWTAWFVAIGAIISAVFISLSKKEWREISDSEDGEVSDVG